MANSNSNILYPSGRYSTAKRTKPKPKSKPTPRPTAESRTGRGGTTSAADVKLRGGAAPKSQPKSTRQGPPVPPRLQNAPKPPKLPAPVRTTAARPSTPARPTVSSRRPAPKPPAVSSAPKATPKVAGTSGIGPVKSGAAYASQKGSISESVRQLREMSEKSKRRQTGQAAPSLSSSKDYSSSFKDMKGGSSRFAAELKKKKRG